MKITALHFPEKSVTNILSILKANNMPPIVPSADVSYNCWSFTAFYCGWKKKVYWMNASEMEDLLASNSTPIDREEVKAGDVAIFRRGPHLSHTAVILPDLKTVYHKPGANELCIDAIGRVADNYGSISYARPEKDEETA